MNTQTLQRIVNQGLSRDDGRRDEACEAILQLLRTETEVSALKQAAFMHESIRCKSGFRELKAIATRTLENYRHDCHRALLFAILLAIAALDTKRSHVFLASVLKGSDRTEVRAIVLTAFAFERRRFDPDLVGEYIFTSQDEDVLRSALYGLLFSRAIDRASQHVKDRVANTLSSEIPSVRDYAVQILWNEPDCRPLIAPLLEDPDENVRDSAKTAMSMFEE